jgi:aspartate 4-decarboxylase
MNKTLLSAMQAMSPFEVKNILTEEAYRSSKRQRLEGKERRILNAGRGNPNFLNTTVRESFCLLSLFISQIADAYLNEEHLGLRPDPAGLARKLGEFLMTQKESRGKTFLKEALAFAFDHFSFNPDEFVFELSDAALGDFYPKPPRIFPMMERVIQAYLNQAMNLSKKIRDKKFNLFCTEGASAAMVYLFYSLKVNKIIREGDEIAILTPIFSPYLEIPELNDFKLAEIFVESKEGLGWRLPDSEIKKLKNPKIKAFFLVNPANPTSVALHKETVKKLGELVRKTRPDLLIISDTVYATFVDDFYSILEEVPENVLCVYSYSKYFGVTGWRLGVIMLSEDNIVDRLIAALPEEEQKELENRYRTVSPQAREVKFIDRLEADSRYEALAHTGGLSCPQQAIMCLFSLFDLIDKEAYYKAEVHQILVKRMKNLFRHLGMKPPPEEGNTYYYVLLDIAILAKEKYGKAFVEHLKKNLHILEFLYRLAEERCTVCLPGEGFHGPKWSLRVSLANLDDDAYIEIGKNIGDVLHEYYEEWERGEEPGVFLWEMSSE